MSSRIQALRAFLRSPGLADGREPLRASLRKGDLAVTRVHRVLAQGNFVLGVRQPKEGLCAEG